MKDIKGRWSTLGKDEKQKYCQEAAALRAHGQAQDLSPEMRELRIKMHLKKLKLEVWKKLHVLGISGIIIVLRCGHTALFIPLTSIHTYCECVRLETQGRAKCFRISLCSKVQAW